MKFLIVRRDNIGDLLCTTPMIHTLRQHYPEARIDALVNSYNSPVLTNNPDLDNYYFYIKAKHRGIGETALGVYWKRLKLMFQLRALKYDLVILAGDGNLKRQLGLVRWLSPRQIIGFQPEGLTPSLLDTPVPRCTDGHEAERSYQLLAPLGITGAPPALVLYPKPELVAQLRQRLLPNDSADPSANPPVVALHISARKVKQRWPVERFAELAHRLHARYGCRFMLFWSPGAADNPHHPGDDEKAAALKAACAGLPLIPCPTSELDELVAGLSLTDQVICADGGAMHVAAGLGKPIVCLFGNSDAARWYPWGVPHQLLQTASRDVNDISVDAVAEAFDRLFAAG
jgi:ADP-heptose:LPS heptosyltransferase